MSTLQAIVDAQFSHKQLLEQVKEDLVESGGCDHDVGICMCHLVRMIEQSEKVQKELDRVAELILRHDLKNPVLRIVDPETGK